MVRAVLLTLAISLGCGPKQAAPPPPPPPPDPGPATADPAGAASTETLFGEVTSALAARDHGRWVKVAATIAVAKKFCPTLFEDPERRAEVERELAGVAASLQEAMNECWEDGDLSQVALMNVVRNELEKDEQTCPGVPMGEAVLAVGQPLRHLNVEYVVTG